LNIAKIKHVGSILKYPFSPSSRLLYFLQKYGTPIKCKYNNNKKVLPIFKIWSMIVQFTSEDTFKIFGKIFHFKIKKVYKYKGNLHYIIKVGSR
jgi:hypothetical protein